MGIKIRSKLQEAAEEEEYIFLGCIIGGLRRGRRKVICFFYIL